MPKVSKQTAAKGGLMTAILGMIGNVVGIGIFFKNGTVFRLNDKIAKTGQYASAIGVLIAWAMSILIVLCMAISFAEIASGKTKNGKAGVGPWAETFCGHKFGRYSKLGYNLIFWPINTFAVMFFAGEALLNCFAPIISEWNGSGWSSVSNYDYGRGTVAYIFLIGAVLFTIFMILNYNKFKSMGKVGKGISFVKFAPIAMVVLIGIIFGVMSNYGNCGLWTREVASTLSNADVERPLTSISFLGAVSCIPAILFSFEGYVAIDSFKNDLKDPDRQIPLGVVMGVVVIAILYLAVTIGCITAGTGDVYQLMKMFLGKNDVAYKVLTMIISIFIFICLIGCVNGMCRGGITSYQELCKDGVIFKGKNLYDRNPGNPYFAGAISFVIVVAIWWVFLFVPSVIMNTDAIADGSSTSMIVCLYVIYGGIVLGAFVNRFNKNIKVNKVKVFPVAAVIGMIGCLFVVGYVAFYQFLGAPITNGINELNGIQDVRSGWGMFAASTETSHQLTNGEVIAWFWAMTAFAALSPIFNDLMIKWWDKKNKNPLMWQKAVKGRTLR